GWNRSDKIYLEEKLVGANGGFPNQGVACDGSRLIVGVQTRDDYDFNMVYAFDLNERGRWTQTGRFIQGDGSFPDYFGMSVAISDGRVIAGAWGENENGDQSGAAYTIDLAKRVGAVIATDGTLKTRVRVSWVDEILDERGFRIYRDGEPIVDVPQNVEIFEDFDAEPGRAYEYGVAVLGYGGIREFETVSDFGWRPPNGSITGRIETRGGAAAEGISVGIDPLPAKALLFDGAGGYVHVDTSAAFNFSAGDSFTVETWIKYSGDGGAGDGDGTIIAKMSRRSGSPEFPFSLANMRGSSEPGRLRFSMSDGADTATVATPPGTDFNDNEWHHVACVHNGQERRLSIYVDGALMSNTTYASLNDMTNDDSLSIGAGAGTGSYFGGQLDDMRIWNVPRSAADIETSRYLPLTGQEDGLVAYWAMDEGTNTVIADVAGAHYGVFKNGVYWTDDCVALDMFPITDEEGNYVLGGIRYGSQATFSVRPFEGERQFDPVYKVITLSTEDPIENQVNFKDISSFTIAGVIQFRGTSCPAPDVTISVDGQPSVTTDKNGKFAVSVDLGEHSIQPVMEGRLFDPDIMEFLHVEGDTSGVAFADTTLRVLSGDAGGGCGRSIGPVILSIRSETNCLVRVDTVFTGEWPYGIDLPPQTYLVSASVIEDSIPPGLNKPDVVRFFQTLGERPVELADTSATMDFVYRAPFIVTVTGMELFADCPDLTFEGQPLPDDLPIIPQETLFEISIKVEEDYGASGTCDLESGTVTIYDEIADREDKPLVLQVQNGVAGVIDTTGQFIPHYRTIAMTPSLIVGRTDEQGNDRSFQKSIRAIVTTEGRAPVTVTEWALVTGHIAPEGADFVTMKTPPMPLYILRDPPGDNSYAILEKGYTTSSTIDFDMGSLTTNEDGIIRNLKTGVSATFAFKKAAAMVLATLMGPLPAPTWGLDTIELNFAFQYDSQKRYTHYEQVDENGATVVTTAIDEVFATSSDDLFTGGDGDVFIGAGLNFVFAEVGVIEVDEGCQVVRSKSVGFEPDGFETIFAYSEQYIADFLIPELESKVAYYTALEKEDSVGVFQKMADAWIEMLLENDNLKWNARLSENHSFSAGADYSYSFTADTTETYRKSTTFFKDDESDKGIYTNLFGFFEFEWLDVDFYHTSEVIALVDTTETQSTTVGYVLSDDDLGDHFTVDIKKDKLYPSPVFDVRAGVSSCPYEPWPDPAGTARMVPRDKPVLSVTPDAT
ncbi:MAG: LamG domain-containing protein, partial [Candidatus Latescibacterota bacterium]